jgi:hypothetical protein
MDVITQVLVSPDDPVEREGTPAGRSVVELRRGVLAVENFGGNKIEAKDGCSD